MKKLIFLLPLLLAGSITTFSQQDPKAEKILNAVSEKFNDYKTIQVKFDYIIENSRKQVSNTVSGSLKLKGDKYKLYFMDNEIFYDGNKLTTYMVEQKEATITQPNTEESGIINPAELFTIWEKDFKYRYRESQQQQNTHHTIDLYPQDPEGKKYFRIRVKINRSTNELQAIKKFNKNGQHYTLKIKKLTPNKTFEEDIFNFKTENHPNVEIIDLTE